ncbi:hypothetical protein [Butyrivibrio sp. VCD2006]|uniref:hypothetical protein n=1 Tax=Butyrivibrio sp. VCD2006 TaxID=1280664 RepID=UPI0003FFA245|nr:hypothetical protein [Butyrivibrio sp. VCD2006]
MKNMIKVLAIVMSFMIFAEGPVITVQARSDAEFMNNAVISSRVIKDVMPVASGVGDVLIDGEPTGLTAVVDNAETYEPSAIKFATSQAEQAVAVVKIILPTKIPQEKKLTVSLWSPQIKDNSNLKMYCYYNDSWNALPFNKRSEHLDLDMTGISGNVLLITKCPSFRYIHNPAENKKVLADAIVNPDAVYGFSPNPESTRLKEYVNALDWTDPVAVANAKKAREDYHKKNEENYRLIESLLAQGKDVETIARSVSKHRNEIRLESHKNDPEGLALLKKSNLETYGNEEGPTADSLYEKYGSWQTVIEKALSSNAGMDACLGLYDEYYDIHEMNQ